MSQFQLNEKQKKALALIKSGKNVFLTGGGGVGKTALIKHVNETFILQGIRVALTALTGIASINLGGCTLHRWAGIGLGQESKEILLTFAIKKSKNWRSTDLLVIDEVSMMSPDLLEKLDYIGRKIRRIDEPFGGIQLLFSGDFCQLPPVKSDMYCFESETWKKCNFNVFHLTENMRQKDSVFQKLLNEVRMGIVTQETRQLLESRLNVELVNEQNIRPTKLFPTKAAVDKINTEELKKISRENNPVYRFKAQNYIANPRKLKITDKQIKNWVGSLNDACPAREEIDLLKEAQVMLIHNLDTDAGLANGSKGIIVDFEDGCPIVTFLNGITRLIKTHEWSLKINEDISVCRKQIPLILAYASTIHKSQSLTIDYVAADLGRDNFADGQFYTALSRVKSLEGLTLIALDVEKCACHPKVIDYYKKIDTIQYDETERVKLIIDN